MRKLVAAALAASAFAPMVLAADDDACAVVAPLLSTEIPLPRVAASLKERRLEVAVVGTGSSILAGTGGTDIAYPARLQIALVQRLPGTQVKVSSYAKPRQTSAEMAQSFGKILSGFKPALVIWQGGTVDAMRGVDPDDFRAALEQGVGALQSGGADVILMNMQYSPRTESMIAIHSYADNMRWVAQSREIPLFDRFAIMKQWSELGIFNFFAATSNVETAARVHECIGKLLADLILEGAKMAETQPKTNQ